MPSTDLQENGIEVLRQQEFLGFVPQRVQVLLHHLSAGTRRRRLCVSSVYRADTGQQAKSDLCLLLDAIHIDADERIRLAIEVCRRQLHTCDGEGRQVEGCYDNGCAVTMGCTVRTSRPHITVTVSS